VKAFAFLYLAEVSGIGEGRLSIPALLRFQIQRKASCVSKSLLGLFGF